MKVHTPCNLKRLFEFLSYFDAPSHAARFASPSRPPTFFELAVKAAAATPAMASETVLLEAVLPVAACIQARVPSRQLRALVV